MGDAADQLNSRLQAAVDATVDDIESKMRPLQKSIYLKMVRYNAS